MEICIPTLLKEKIKNWKIYLSLIHLYVKIPKIIISTNAVGIKEKNGGEDAWCITLYLYLIYSNFHIGYFDLGHQLPVKQVVKLIRLI